MIGDDLDDVAGVAAEFRRELEGLSGAMAGAEAGAKGLTRSLSRSLGGALEGVIFDGARASEALERVARSVVGSAYRGAMKPVTDHLAGLVTQGVQGLAGAMVPFAKGGVVSQPVAFPMAGATGVAGEAGPEAILPLARGSDGRLGVRSQGGGRPVVVNIHTPDVESFARSRSQVAAQVGRMLAAGGRNR